MTVAPRALASVSGSAQLEAAMVELTHDPLAFVMACFPWGETGTPLAGEAGPRPWQAEVLRDIGDQLQAQAVRGITEPIRVAVSSGHSVGKSALVAWLTQWGVSTFPNARVVVTANTEQQLRTKTWPEMVKWLSLLPCRHWFDHTDTSITARDPACARTWRADRVTWSENNTEAFAGLHNKGNRIVLIFDEASAIDDGVWQVAEGALTDADTEIIWIVMGNPTRNVGRFRECFGSQRHRWSTRTVDARTVPGVNLSLIAQWAVDYGDDSDFFRVRVKGEFPRAGSSQFIGGDLVDAARKRPVPPVGLDALVLGVDVARHGDDMTVIYPRRGRDARSIPPIKLRVPDLMQVAGRVAALATELGADAVFVDAGGMGAGVLDRLLQLNIPGVMGVEFGSRPAGVSFNGETAKYANRRAEMWGNMRAWLAHGAIVDDAELAADLVGPEYGYDAQNAIQLERKRDMKRRGLASPNVGDALACSFAYPVQPRHSRDPNAGKVLVDYDPWAEEELPVIHRHAPEPAGPVMSSYEAGLKGWR